MDLMGIRSIIICSLEEDVEIAEKPMHLEGKSNGIAWPINIDTFDKMDNTNVKHVKNSNSGLFGLALFDVSINYRSRKGYKLIRQLPPPLLN